MDEENKNDEFDKLLQIEKKLDSLHVKYDTVTQLLHNNDLLLKQIVNRLNVIVKAQQQVQTIELKEEVKSEQVVIKASEGMKTSQEPIAPRRRDVQSTDEFSNKDIKNGKDLVASFVTREADNMEPSAKKNSVTQQVQDRNKKMIFMASVEIFSNSKLVYTTKTNASGFWSALLPAGNYEISITKKDVALKKTLTFNDKIVIKDALDVISLKGAILE